MNNFPGWQYSYSYTYAPDFLDVFRYIYKPISQARLALSSNALV